MAAQTPIETLNDLFTALFRPGEGEKPVIRQPRRPLREALFALFFPDALVRQYADKSKSNLTWFFNNDVRNKSVRRSLAALLREDARATITEAHRKAHEALWPAPGRAEFDAAALRRTLGAVRIPEALDARWHILTAAVPPTGRVLQGEDALSRLDAFFEADEAAALSRIILTLAVSGDVPTDVMGEIWRGGPGVECAFMRLDDSVSGSIRYCRMLDLQGKPERALEGYERIARQLNRPAQTVDESAMYCRMGELLFNGEGCARDEKLAQAYDRLGCLDENPRSWHQLSLHVAGPDARQAIERAAELGYAPAIRQLGLAWYNGSARLGCARSQESARRVFQLGLALPGADGAFCACMLGRIYEAQGDRDAAVSAYRVAREGGNAEAAGRLAALDWVLPPRDGAASGLSLGEKGYCIVNSAEGCNLSFMEGLTGRWEIAVCGAEGGAALPPGAKPAAASADAALARLAEGVYWGGAPRFPRLLVALMSGDEARNVRDAVGLLVALRRLAESLGDRAWDLVEQVRVYVMARQEYAAPLLDAVFAGMAPLYFRLRICDVALDAAERLLASAPLFLPRLRAPEDAPVRLKLVGCGDAAMAVLLRALAQPLPEAAELGVDVFGEGAEAMGRRFAQRCPGLAKGAKALGVPVPRFHECPPEELLTAMLEGPGGLADGDYYVVAAGDDALNLRLGMLLRGALLRRDPGAERQPFIAVHARDPVTGWLAAGLPAGGEAGSAFGQYELYPFGALDMYAPQALEAEALERRACQAHMLNLGLPNTRDARHTAMGSYYGRQFNRETARLEALCLAGRMHMAGLSLPDWRLYGLPEEEARLAAGYTRWLKQEDNLRRAVRDEHARRCRALLTLGWSPAAPDQVAAYVRRGNPGHILHPARLNPFICPWEALEAGELLNSVREIVRSRFPEKTVPDPRREEEASLLDTERILAGI